MAKRRQAERRLEQKVLDNGAGDAGGGGAAAADRLRARSCRRRADQRRKTTLRHLHLIPSRRLITRWRAIRSRRTMPEMPMQPARTRTSTTRSDHSTLREPQGRPERSRGPTGSAPFEPGRGMKLAVIVQRYGQAINGGAELH